MSFGGGYGKAAKRIHNKTAVAFAGYDITFPILDDAFTINS